MWRLLVLVLLFLPSLSHACGTVHMYFKAYKNKTTLQAKQKHLERSSCGEVINYYPHSDDPLIAKVMFDAIDNSLESKLIKKILKRHNCAYGARNSQEYSIIKTFIGEQRFNQFCQVSILDKAYIVNVKGGANMRSGPELEAEKIDSIRHGVLVNGLAEQNGWVKVRYLKSEGYIHKSLLVSY